MRTNLISTITHLAEKDPRIILMAGDLGYSVIEEFQTKFPDRFINAGVAEQDMMGMATGLALSGNIVFTYSFINFSTFRCLEQIRNDIAYHNANVKIIGIGAGFSYGTLGMTHHGVDDVPIMTAIPNITVITPCDPVEAILAGNAVVEWDGPCYLRIRRNGEKKIHTEIPKFSIGKGIIIQPGSDITLIGTGWIMQNVIDAAKLLEKDGYSVRIISMHTIKPLDRDLILKSAHETGAIVTIEDQTIQGLGAKVALELMSSYSSVPFMALGLRDNYYMDVGTEDYHLNKANLSVQGIYKETLRFLQERQRL